MVTYTLSLEPFYDTHHGCYRKVITIDRTPTGPLTGLVKKVKPALLSPFQKSFDPCCKQKGCLDVIHAQGDVNNLLTVDDLPSLYSFLVTNGYTIDTAITQMMNQSEVRMSNPLICFISY